jgi:pimeloyl-ACP methyl ester carboxylesterase
MTRLAFAHDVLHLAGYDRGKGPPVVFQHGMGGDVNQVNEHFPLDLFRCLTLECRAHGGSDAGPSERFSIPQFAEDVMAFADERGVSRFAVGGISMGAALALRIAVLAPERVSALILARPAWAWRASPDNMQVFLELAPFLRGNDRSAFEATATAKHFASQAPDNYNSLLAAFSRPEPTLFADLGSHIAQGGPNITEKQVAALNVPTLVLGNDTDLIHPMSLAEELAATIPQARLMKLTSKAADKVKHALEFRAAVASFLIETGHVQ